MTRSALEAEGCGSKRGVSVSSPGRFRLPSSALRRVAYNALVNRTLFLLAMILAPVSGVAQSWWGNFNSANDTYQDIPAGSSFSFRLVAPWNGAVTAAAFPVTNLGVAPIADAGVLSVQPDDGSGFPSGAPVTSVPATLLANWNRIPLPAVALAAGVTYHFVYTVGVHPVRLKSGDLYNDRWIPSASAVNEAWNWLSDVPGSWTVAMRDPAFVLEFADGRAYGNPYNDNSPTLNVGIGGGAVSMELHDQGTPGIPLDDRCAGQVFRTPGSGVCRAYGFELKEPVFQAPNAPLQWTLEEAATGFDVASGTAPVAGGLWYGVTFGGPVTLWSQREYRLWFKAAQPPASPHVLSCAWHAGSGAEWSRLTWQGTQGRAQSSTDGGSTWTDHPEGDLAFRVDIDPSPLPVTREEPSLWISKNLVFQGETIRFDFQTVDEGETVLAVFNSAGERIREVFRDRLPRGTTATASWDGKNRMGEEAATGLYLVHFSSPRGAQSQLFLRVR